MSVESKIKELLGRVESQTTLNEDDERNNPPMQGSSRPSEKAGSMMDITAEKKDMTMHPASTGDIKQPKQGGSEESHFDEFKEYEPYEGEDDLGREEAEHVTPVAKTPTYPMGKGAGATPNFTTVGDPTTAVNIQQGKGNIAREEVDLESIFGEDLSEEFREKASAIFEAAVIARVNSEMDNVISALQEKFSSDVEEFKESLVEKVDGYMNYVVENWMKENELVIEKGLRTEIAEDFMSGLKVLFKEHYIEVPEEKYDVLSELQTKAEELEESLNDAISYNVELNKEVISLKRNAIVESMSKDLAATEVSKLGKLLEGVDFENEALYREKVAVIKENYFPKATATEVSKSVQSQQTLIEETDTTVSFADNSTVSSYARALSRRK